MEYRSDGFNASNPANYKNIKDQGYLNADGQTMEAVTVTADMLGLFYYFYEIDFDSMSGACKLQFLSLLTVVTISP